MGGMDGKVRKILNHLKKSGGDLEAIDLAFALKMDENFVQNALDSLDKDGLAAGRRTDQGKVLWSAADESAPKGKSAKEEAASGDDLDEFVLEDEIVNEATETIVASVEDFLPKAAPAPTPPATAVFETSVPKAPTPPATSVFETSVPKAPTPPATSVFEASAQKAEPTPPASPDDDFEPKSKKVKDKKEKKEKVADASMDFQPKADPEPKAEKVKPDADADAAGAKTPSKGMMSAVMVIGLIAAIIIAVAAAGYGKKAAATAESVKTELSGKIETLNNDADARIKALEEKNKILEDKVENLQAEIKKQGQADSKSASPAKKKKK